MNTTRRVFLQQSLATVALASGVASAAAGATPPTMSDAERAKLVDYLERSQREFLDLLAEVTEAQWRWKPGPDRWSVAECAQHIVVAEDFLFGQAMLAMKNPPDADWEAKVGAKTALLERILPDRSRKVQAPEPLNPAQVSFTRDQAISAFKEKRELTLRFAHTTTLALHMHLTKGLFPVFDPLDAYQFVLYIPLHNIRHNQQIAEVKAAPEFARIA